MDVTGNAAACGATYTQRATTRIERSDRLRAELNGLHPILDRDLARIREIAPELRRLADEQRRDEIPDPSYQAHRTCLWRKLDVLARLADDLAEADGWAQEVLAAEYQAIINRGPRVTKYDSALMTLSGEPLTDIKRPPPPAEPEISVFVVIFGFLGVVGLLAVMAILAANGHIVTGVLILFGAAMASKPLAARFIPDLASPLPAAPVSPTEPCPGYGAYVTVHNHELAILNTHLGAAEDESFDHYAATADLLASLGRMRRICAPHTALHYHDMATRLIEGWVSLIRNALDGTWIEGRAEELNALAEQSRKELATVDAICLGQ